MAGHLPQTIRGVGEAEAFFDRQKKKKKERIKKQNDDTSSPSPLMFYSPEKPNSGRKVCRVLDVKPR